MRSWLPTAGSPSHLPKLSVVLKAQVASCRQIRRALLEGSNVGVLKAAIIPVPTVLGPHVPPGLGVPKCSSTSKLGSYLESSARGCHPDARSNGQPGAAP
jgi:hypothetical protein